MRGLALLPALLLLAGGVHAKEYNKREGMDPAATAKLQRTLTTIRTQDDLGPDDGTRGDIVNTGCGKLGIGNVSTVRPGQRIDRDIIITGDVINAPQGCKRR